MTIPIVRNMEIKADLAKSGAKRSEDFINMLLRAPDGGGSSAVAKMCVCVRARLTRWTTYNNMGQ